METIPSDSYLQLNGEDIKDANLLKECSVSNYERLLANIPLLVIDEAQHIPDIGMILKLIVDSIRNSNNMKIGQVNKNISTKL